MPSSVSNILFRTLTSSLIIIHSACGDNNNKPPSPVLEFSSKLPVNLGITINVFNIIFNVKILIIDYIEIIVEKYSSLNRRRVNSLFSCRDSENTCKYLLNR